MSADLTIPVRMTMAELKACHIAMCTVTLRGDAITARHEAALISLTDKVSTAQFDLRTRERAAGQEGGP